MKPKFYFLLLSLFSITGLFTSGQTTLPDDTLFIVETLQAPVIDGQISDTVWQKSEWNYINQIWMPYNNLSSNLGQEAGLKLWEGADDFTGRFKVMWSSDSNLLYFLVEITDDVFTGGYVYNENPNSGGGYPNYDIVEVFIDEDRSGGLHVFDGTGNVATQWGTNAENAFSYHLATDKPEPGQVQTMFHALDIAGTNWGYPNQKIPDYSNHFQEFAVTNEGNKYIYEFSLKVYNDSYLNSNPGASRVSLFPGKIMGLSLAYCDNDNPEETPLQRDNFFGSVYVPPAAYNDHWKQANGYGVAKLSESLSTSSVSLQKEEIKIGNRVSGRQLYTSVNSVFTGKIGIRVFNIFGQQVMSETGYKSNGSWSESFSLQELKAGVYLVETIHANKRVTSKIIVQ